jgi:hypothetical protein
LKYKKWLYKKAINIQSTDTPTPHYLSCISAPEEDLNLVVIEFLVLNDKGAALAKLKEFPIKDLRLLNAATDAINEIDSVRVLKKSSILIKQ